ncbi:DNA-binding protein [Streptomyces sp. NPDC007346]|uniref:DNA-binding protein n=1 Tax=Streptomyces sp. NPDC007346 TaxID=3154682 RepID=UPI0034524801
MTQTIDVAVRELTTRDLLDLPPTTDVETAARALGIGRTHAYHLARNDRFPCSVLRAGRSFRVVTADLQRVLQASPPPESVPAA